MNKLNDPKVIVALDFSEYQEVIEFVNPLSPSLCRLKVGKELFTRFGPQIVMDLQNKGFEIFLDLKFHDIPTTVARACEAAADLGVWMLNVHVMGGRRMLEAAQKALINRNNKPYLIGVTLLTSFDQDDMSEIGITGRITSRVEQLAILAFDVGLDGVVCSAQEAAALRKIRTNNFLLVTPGIRLDGERINDQKRVVTPQVAMANGASYLVIGRPITQARDPLQMLQRIHSEISTKTASASNAVLEEVPPSLIY